METININLGVGQWMSCDLILQQIIYNWFVGDVNLWGGNCDFHAFYLKKQKAY